MAQINICNLLLPDEVFKVQIKLDINSHIELFETAHFLLVFVFEEKLIHRYNTRKSRKNNGEHFCCMLRAIVPYFLLTFTLFPAILLSNNMFFLFLLYFQQIHLFC